MLNKHFLSSVIFVLFFAKSDTGGPVHLKINLASPYEQLDYSNLVCFSTGPADPDFSKLAKQK